MVRGFRSRPTRRALLGAALAIGVGGRARSGDGLTVFAAASLKPALDAFVADWPMPLAISYGGSGTMARQVAAGAPADVVILAARDWMEWLAGEGVLDGAPVNLATNRLILAAPPGAKPVELTEAALLARLGPEGRMAMGDPMSVPAGRYGQQALETLGLWAQLAPRALTAENVRAALAFVARGDVPLALVYRSDARGTGVEVAATIPASAHAPIRYPAAQVAGARPGAAALLAALGDAGPLFAAHGFAP